LSVINYPGEENEWRFMQKATDWDGGRTGYVINFGESKGILYEMSDDRSEFWIGEYVGTLADLEIPELFFNRPVTKIYDKAFFNIETLESVYVPDTVNHIYTNALYNCPNLKEVTVIGTDVEMGHGMIYGCSELEMLQVPFLGNTIETSEVGYLGYFFGAPTYIENENFVPVTLCELIITDISVIPAYAFMDCKFLKDITVPETVTVIGKYAYAGCEGLEGVLHLPESTITINEGAFEFCQNLTGIDFPDGVESIGANAFAGCALITKLTVPDTVTSIGDNAFANCALLTEFIIPDSVTSIGITVLNNCSGVRSITIGAGITEIPDTAVGTPLFGLNKATSSLESYIISPENKTFVTDGYGVLYETMKISDSEYIEVAVLDAPAKSNLKDYTLPEHIVYIAPYAFAYNTTLRWIQLDRVRRIDNHAFLACTSLVGAIFGQKPDDSVDVTPENPEYAAKYAEFIAYVATRSDAAEQYSQFVGDYAFSGCTMLQYVNLYSDFIVAIGEEAFYDCNALTSVHLNKSLERIGLRAFGKTSLEGITVHAENPHFKSIDKVLYEKKDDGSYTLLLYPTHKIAVGVSAFTEANGKKYQTAFAVPAVDDNGKKVHISAIESYAFQEAEWLNDVTLDPWGEMIVGDYAFLNAKIETVRIGANVLSLGLKRGEGEYTVFSDCEDLTSIEVDGGNPYYSSKGGV
ncbi:MAG: leucine-rich repeat protein, partial [Clostridia bacterium]|nr:leucine-rich repeat protein [Clostridia bacterium]